MSQRIRSRHVIDRDVFPLDPSCIVRGDVRGGIRKRVLLEFAEDFPILFRDETWIVPKGFITDGASIPRPAFSIAGGPYSDTYVYAAFLHDLLYCIHAKDWTAKLAHLRHIPASWVVVEREREDRPMSRAEADRIFRDLFPACGQPRYRAAYFHAAVRMNLLASWREDVR